MEGVKLLSRTEEQDVEVSREDQAKINQFSKLTTNLEILQAKYDEVSKEKQYLEDLELELELLDEDTKLDYKIGDAFVLLSHEEAMQRIEQEKEAAQETTDSLNKEIETVASTLDSLKSELYKKFGNSINLDKD
ncbi:hypothetical protein BB560_003007 [Smittium megazygosporum]|uniref:Prefoldin subunit 4 n=1 Tax=Smittium megazygosporum TaxID=133381 RepID=A0A2T9ZD60_9FUNG|nr:hypothetical protein BB560_003007 [Smittium megazygosporum]